MSNLKNYSLLLKLICGIIGGILIGLLGWDILVRIFITFNSIFGSLLSFTVPLIILAFITNGIADLGSGSRKLLGMTVLLSYSSSVLMGFMAYGVDIAIFPSLLKGETLSSLTEMSNSLAPYITFDIPPIMSVTTALILSFILGIGLSNLSDSPLKQVFQNFHDIVYRFITSVIIPLLPIYIAGVFANMTYSGQAGSVMSAFIKVFAIVIALHFIALIIQYVIAGAMNHKNPFVLIKNMLPAYFTALGTQSSAATIPVTANCIKSNGVKVKVAEFVAPLCANIHMSGSIITITSCALAVMMLTGHPFTVGLMIPFILMLGVMMVASPGMPGGSIMAAIGVLQSILGFNDAMIALMIALYLAQDSFGTACNVTGDGAIALMVDTLTE